MNKRIFLFGLGVGIIVGAGLLQLMLIGEKQAAELDAQQTKTAEVRTYTQAELDQAVSDERKRVQAEVDLQHATAPVDKPEKTPPKSDPVTGTQSESNTQTQTAAKPTRIIVRIPPNASVVVTAELLADRGVITDKKAFINLMRKRTIRAGYFSFTGKVTLQQVKSIITGKPMDPETAKSQIAAGKG